METTQVNLCRALKLKNRLASRLSRIDQLIVTHNSSVKDYSEYQVRDLYKSRMLLAEQLVELKVAISAVNQSIQKQIFEVAECKALCHMLNRINTRHGPQSSGYDAIQEYTAQFREADIQKEVRKVEKEIDRLQDQLDQFNFDTRITIPKNLLEDSNETETV